MKTIFKVGQKVYDQVNFPNSEGTVTEIQRDVDGYWYVRVVFRGDDYFYHMDGTFGLCSIPTLSIKPYEVELKGFEQGPPLSTYEEAVQWLNKNSEDMIINDSEGEDVYINKESEEAFKALKKLVILREFYNEGWEPDWEEEDVKYTIFVAKGELDTGDTYYFNTVLYFKDDRVRDRFLREQWDLLETAKPLL